MTEPTPRPRLALGFTLVELMIVVVILGILAAVAVPAFTRYVKRSKTSEALINIRASYNGQASYYNMSGERYSIARFVNQPYFTPDNTPRASKYPANAALWAADAEWSAIGFAINTSHYYCYNSSSPNPDGIGAYFYAHAVGNLDGDSVESTFTIRGDISPSGEVQRSRVDIVQELE